MDIGLFPFYVSEKCNIDNDNVIDDECDYSYENSIVKKIIDGWASDFVIEVYRSVDDEGYFSRIISLDDYINKLGFEWISSITKEKIDHTESTPKYFFNSIYNKGIYWTMTKNTDSDGIYYVENAVISNGLKVYKQAMIKPVVTIKKEVFNYPKTLKMNTITKENYYEGQVII